MNDTTPIETGDRFEDHDARSGNRVVRVIEKQPGALGFYTVEVEVAELNPKTVGRHSTIHESTLRRRYRRISR